MKLPAAGTHPVRTPQPTPDPFVDEWISGIEARLASSDAATRAAARDEIARLLDPSPGPYVAPTRDMLAALRVSIANGALADNPDAHLAFARLCERQRDPRGVERSVARAVHLARKMTLATDISGRKRASEINFEATKLYASIGKLDEAMHRLRVSRYLTVTRDQRLGRLGVPIAPPAPGDDETARTRATAIGPRFEDPPLPPELAGEGESGQMVPPTMHGPVPVPGFLVIDLLNTIGATVGACRKLSALADYTARIDSNRFLERFFTAPDRPRRLADFRNEQLRLLQSPDPTVRRRARELLAGIASENAIEEAEAYWGEP